METNYDPRLTILTGAVSRRTALHGLGAAGIAAGLGLASPHRTLAGQASTEMMIEPEAGSWKTWILESGDQFRPDAPPDETATQDELTQAQRHGGRPRCRRAGPHLLLGCRLSWLPLE